MHATLHKIGALPVEQIGRWNDFLVSRSPVKSAFLSHAFCKAVDEVRGNVNVLHIQTKDSTEGFLPFQLRSGRSMLGHAENVGSGVSDFFGIVGNLRAGVDIGALLQAAGLSALRFDHGVPTLCPFAFEELEIGSGMRLFVESFDQFRQQLEKNNKEFSRSVFSRERRLVREEGDIEFSWKSAERQSLEQLIARKREQYLRTGVHDSLGSDWQRDLLQRLVDLPAVKECEAIVSTLRAGGKWIGSKLSLLCADTLHSWFSVYDPQYRRHGPGHLVWFKVIEHGSKAGIKNFDFGEGESNYKAEYGGENYELWKGVARMDTLQGRTERIMQSLQWRAEALLRNRRIR